MIEVFKIIKQKYDSFAVPELLPSYYNATRGNIYKLLNHSFHSKSVTYENFTLLHVLLTYGIVYQIITLLLWIV